MDRHSHPRCVSRANASRPGESTRLLFDGPESGFPLIFATSSRKQAREQMEKKLAQDGRRAEAEILIQEMLDAFRSKLEQEYADKIKGERLLGSARRRRHCRNTVRLFYIDLQIRASIWDRENHRTQRGGPRGRVGSALRRTGKA